MGMDGVSYGVSVLDYVDGWGRLWSQCVRLWGWMGLVIDYVGYGVSVSVCFSILV
jgi:hypothetical protein